MKALNSIVNYKTIERDIKMLFFDLGLEIDECHLKEIIENKKQ